MLWLSTVVFGSKVGLELDRIVYLLGYSRIGLAGCT